MNCKFCGRECKNKNSLVNHERLCKSNPNRKYTPFQDKSFQERIRKEKIESGKLNQWSNPEYKISESTRKKFIESSTGRTHSEETKKKISEARKKFLLGNPDKVPYLINHYSNGPSYPEKYFEEIFQNNNIKVEKEFRILNYSLDFAIPSKKIDIEIDGDQHYLDKRIVENDNRRNEKLEELGWKIYRIRWSDYQKMSREEKERFVQDFIQKLK